MKARVELWTIVLEGADGNQRVVFQTLDTYLFQRKFDDLRVRMSDSDSAVEVKGYVSTVDYDLLPADQIQGVIKFRISEPVLANGSPA